MEILQDVSLLPYNTFGINVFSKYFGSVTSTDEVLELLDWLRDNNNIDLVIGGGSNILLTKNFEGLVMKNEINHIEIIKEDAAAVWLKVGAGVVWHEFVLYCLKNNYAGIENLALIPGCVGASPMQNIGAYGVEVKEVIERVTTVEKATGKITEFSKEDCEFGYRESIFKNKFLHQFIITDVTYKLYKQPQFNIGYGAIQQELDAMKIQELSIQNIAQAVINIRTSKLPNPKVIGNAGSFFKNPSVSKINFERLKEKYTDIVAYENTDGTMKLAAGWMIEQCGLKGYRKGNAGVHAKQSLVLVNYGNATGDDILEIKNIVIEAVMEKFGIVLSPEVNII